jgi:glycosyltransferase involved in cell wall biosynthesis
VLPNGISARTISPVPEEPRAYFVGKLDYAPNYEGLQWLTTEVWPLVRRELPGAELLVAGSGALPPAVAATVASSSGVSLLGEVDSIDELQRRARVALVPILTGGGTRLKLLEACAGGRAIVTTPVGGEGLELPGFVAVAGTPAGFAQETVRRLRDRALVEREGRALADWVSDKRWDVLVEQTLVPLLRGARAAAAERG